MNQALQLGLDALEETPAPEYNHHTETRSLKIKAGYDQDKLGQIADEMEDSLRIKKEQFNENRQFCSAGLTK